MVFAAVPRVKSIINFSHLLLKNTPLEALVKTMVLVRIDNCKESRLQLSVDTFALVFCSDFSLLLILVDRFVVQINSPVGNVTDESKGTVL